MKRVALLVGIAGVMAIAGACVSNPGLVAQLEDAGILLPDGAVNLPPEDGATDTGPAAHDAGVQDAGAHDAAPGTDATVNDAAPGEDAGAVDAHVDGEPDATPVDSSAPDSGGSDAGGDAADAGGGVEAGVDSSVTVTITAGADAGVYGDASTSCGFSPGPQPASFFTKTNVVVTADAGPQVITVPDGFVITPNVTLSGSAPAGSTLAQPSVTVNDGTSVNTYGYSGESFALPAGRWPLVFSQSAIYSNSAIATRTGFDYLDVCGETTLNATLPAFPALTAVNLTVPASAVIATPTPTSIYLTLVTDDQTLSVGNGALVTAGVPTTISLVAPFGTPLHVFVASQNPQTIVQLPDVTLTGDATLAGITTWTASGTATETSTLSTTATSYLSCAVGPQISAANPFPPMSGIYTGTFTGGASPYSYTLLVPAQDAGVDVPCTPVADYWLASGNLATLGAYPGPFTGNITFNFTDQGLDSLFEPLSVSVVDARGTPLNALLQGLGALSPAGSFLTSGSATTTTAATLQVVPGTYGLTASPQ